MRADNQNSKKGIATLELLIAFSFLALAMTGAVLVSFGGQTSNLDVNLTSKGFSHIASSFEKNTAAAIAGWDSFASASETKDIYTLGRVVLNISECMKQVSTNASWVTEKNRGQGIALVTLQGSTTTARALGGDCTEFTSEKKWDDPQRFAFDTLSPGKSTTIDVFSKIAYLGFDKEPFWAIADTRGAVLDKNNAQDFFVTFANSFNSDGEAMDQVNDIDVYKDNATGKSYAFVALASTTAQFGVIDVTDIYNPVLVVTRQLSGITAPNSSAWGWRIYYYAGRLYITARETAGPELHIFDVSDPMNPSEIGKKELNTTVNDFVVRDGIAYFADESDTRGELLIYDVSNPIFTDPNSIFELTNASRNLPGNQNGASIFLLGGRLYFGREAVSGGPELYVFDASDPRAASGGVPTIGTPTEIGASVWGINVTGRFGFLVTSKPGEEFQVWNISDFINPTLIKKYNFGNIVAGGIDYEPDFIYATGSATPNFQILWSPT